MQEDFQSIFDGLLLSDGGIRLQPRKINCVYYQSSSHRGFLLHVMEILKQNGFTFGDWCPSRYVVKKMNNAVIYGMNSRVNSYSTSERKRWYPEGKKIVPRDLILTPLAVKYWYYGDGSLSYAHGETLEIHLATHGFTDDDAKFLQERLQKDCGFSSRLHREKGKPVIVIRRTNMRDFLEYIGSWNFDCYRYKWIIQNRQLYNEYKLPKCLCKI